MSESSINTLVVVGSGINVAMAAAVLSAQLNRHEAKLVVVELKSETCGPEAETCGPEFWPLCELNGLRPRDLIAKAQGTFRLGSLYRSDARRWFVPYGAYGLQAPLAGFESAMLKALRLSKEGGVDAFSVAASAAASGKFALPAQDRPDLCNALKAGVILSARRYQQNLAAASRSRELQWVSARELTRVDRDSAGNIRRVMLNTGETITGDFWIDCTEDKGVLQAENKKDMPLNLPWDSVAYACSAYRDTTMPADEYQKMPWGWLRRKALQQSVHYELFYKSGEVENRTLKQVVRQMASDETLDLKHRKLDIGATTEPWLGNCLGVGHAAANIGELVFSDLALVQAGIVMFLDLFPVGPGDEWSARHYNEQWLQYVREAHEYTALHGVVDEMANRTGEPTASRLPRTLVQKVEIFKRRGKVEEAESDAVLAAQWLGMLYGMGFRPMDSSLNLEIVPDEKLLLGVEKIRERIRSTVATMPKHDAFIHQYFKEH